MDYYKFYFGDFTNHGKHNSSYFNLPAALVLTVAMFLPGILNLMTSYASYFATLILIAVGAFERKSDMIKYNCYQFCFLSMFSNLTLTALYLIGLVFAPAQYINACLSIVFGVIVLFSFFYIIYNAFRYRTWRIPFLSALIDKLMERI